MANEGERKQNKVFAFLGKYWGMKLIIFICVLSFIFFSVAGSQIKEIKPGDGFNLTRKEISVHASNPEWSNTGIATSSFGTATSNIEAKITGDLYLCGGEERFETKTLLIDYVLCADGSRPKYPSEEEFLNAGSRINPYKNYPWDTDSVCPAVTDVSGNPISRFAESIDYQNVGIKVSQYDRISFDLVKVKKTINSCNSIPFGISFDDTLFLNSSRTQKASESQVCAGGKMYRFDGELIELDSKSGDSFEEYRSEDPSPYGNTLVASRISSTWVAGSFADSRIDPDPNFLLTNTSGVTPPKYHFNCTNLTGNRAEFFKYTSKAISAQCGFDAGRVPSMYGYSKLVDSSGKELMDSNGRTQEYAELLIAKIGGGNSYGSTGLCLNGFTNNSNYTNNISESDCLSNKNYDTAILQSSLRLNYNFIINNDIQGQDLKLIIADWSDAYKDNLGGYNVFIKQSCYRADAQNLYAYIGDKSPVELASDGKPLMLDGTDSRVMRVKDFLKNKDNEIYDISGMIGSSTGKLFFIIQDNGDGYNNNSGSYSIEMEMEVVPTIISDIVKLLTNPIKELFAHSATGSGFNTVYQGGITKEFYDNLLNNGIKDIVLYVLLLYIVLFGIGYTLGLSETRASEFIKIAGKIGLMLVLLSDTSWSFLNKYFFNIFWFGTDYLITAFAKFFNDNGPAEYTSAFIFLDKSIGVLFQWQNLVRLFSLLGTGLLINPICLFFFFTIAKGLINLLIGGIKGVLYYSTAIIINGFLIGLAPLFLSFILFKTTYSLFDAWVKQIIINMMVVVLYFASIGFLNEIVYFSLYQILNFGAYMECLLPIHLGPINLCLVMFPMSFSSYPVIAPDANFDYASMVISATIPIKYTHLIIFYIITTFYLAILEIIPTLSSMLFGGSLMFSISSVARSAMDGLAYPIGMDNKSQQKRQEAINSRKNKYDTGGKEDGNEEKAEPKVGFRK